MISNFSFLKLICLNNILTFHLSQLEDSKGLERRCILGKYWHKYPSIESSYSLEVWNEWIFECILHFYTHYLQRLLRDLIKFRYLLAVMYTSFWTIYMSCVFSNRKMLEVLITANIFSSTYSNNFFLKRNYFWGSLRLSRNILKAIFRTSFASRRLVMRFSRTT